MDIFRTGVGAQIHSIAIGVFFLISQNLFCMMNIANKVRINPQKMITSHQNWWVSTVKDRFPQKWLSTVFFGEMSRAAGTRFKKKRPPWVFLDAGGGPNLP